MFQSQTPDNVPDVDVVIVKEETDDTEEKPGNTSLFFIFLDNLAFNLLVKVLVLCQLESTCT